MMEEIGLILTSGTIVVLILFITWAICLLHDKDRWAKRLVISMGVIIVVILSISLIAVYYESFK